MTERNPDGQRKPFWQSTGMQIGLPALLSVICSLLEYYLGTGWLLFPAAGFLMWVASACCSHLIANQPRRWRVLIVLSVATLATSQNQTPKLADKPSGVSAANSTPPSSPPKPVNELSHKTRKVAPVKNQVASTGDCPDGYGIVLEHPIVEAHQEKVANMTGFYVDNIGPCGVKMTEPRAEGIARGFDLHNQPAPKKEPQPATDAHQ